MGTRGWGRCNSRLSVVRCIGFLSFRCFLPPLFLICLASLLAALSFLLCVCVCIQTEAFPSTSNRMHTRDCISPRAPLFIAVSRPAVRTCFPLRGGNTQMGCCASDVIRLAFGAWGTLLKQTRYNWRRKRPWTRPFPGGKEAIDSQWYMIQLPSDAHCAILFLAPASNSNPHPTQLGRKSDYLDAAATAFPSMNSPQSAVNVCGRSVHLPMSMHRGGPPAPPSVQRNRPSRPTATQRRLDKSRVEVVEEGHKLSLRCAPAIIAGAHQANQSGGDHLGLANPRLGTRPLPRHGR